MRALFSIIILLILANTVCSQTAKKSIKALRVSSSMVIDGQLNEAAWQQAETATDFITESPDPGNPASQKTEVMVLYSDKAIYVGAHLWDEEPELILRQMGTRDNMDLNADYFGVSFDTYHDGQNAFTFVVSASGVQADVKFSQDNEDVSWNAVWESKVILHDRGWTVEMRIPYSALRFGSADKQEWGANFYRNFRRIREESFWSPIDPDIDGFVHQFGVVTGFENIKSPIRLSLHPYIAGYIRHNPKIEIKKDQTAYSLRGGLDLKYGLSQGFTLDMTLIPDFGQVQSDNEVLNLSPFETRYDENRPFFTEGTEMFQTGNLFYSRRVGGRPVGFYNVAEQVGDNEKIISNPQEARLINATKVSGRTATGLGIGLFNAISSSTFATIEKESGGTRHIQTQPMTNMNVLVLDQAMKNNSRVSLVNTNVTRNGRFEDANVTGLFFNFYDESISYNISGSAVVSLNGISTPEGIEPGFRYGLHTGKTSGKWRFYLSHAIENNTYDPNDLGFLYNNNEIFINPRIGYVQNSPKGNLNKMNFWLWGYHSTLYKPREFSEAQVGFSPFFLFKSFLAAGGEIAITPVTTYDHFEPRVAGKSFAKPPGFNGYIFISPDYRKRFIADVNLGFNRIPGFDFTSIWINLAPRFRFSDRFSVYPQFNVSKAINARGFAEMDSTGAPIFGRRDQWTISQSISGTFIFSSKMGLTLRARHYWSEADYDRFYDLKDDGTLQENNYEGSVDINFNALNIDLAFEWEFSPGSQLSIVWKSANLTSDDIVGQGYFKNLEHITGNAMESSFSVKLLYYLDYNMVFGKAK